MNTPTPWKLGANGSAFVYALNANGVNRMWFAVQPGDTDEKKRTPEPELEANAALIVRAVNSHQALIDALEHLVRLLAPVEAGELSVPGLATLNEARAALKLAKGEA